MEPASKLPLDKPLPSGSQFAWEAAKTLFVAPYELQRAMTPNWMKPLFYAAIAAPVLAYELRKRREKKPEKELLPKVAFAPLPTPAYSPSARPVVPLPYRMPGIIPTPGEQEQDIKARQRAGARPMVGSRRWEYMDPTLRAAYISNERRSGRLRVPTTVNPQSMVESGFQVQASMEEGIRKVADAVSVALQRQKLRTEVNNPDPDAVMKGLDEFEEAQRKSRMRHKMRLMFGSSTTTRGFKPESVHTPMSGANPTELQQYTSMDGAPSVNR
jgi:hypothetical protein